MHIRSGESHFTHSEGLGSMTGPDNSHDPRDTILHDTNLDPDTGHDEKSNIDFIISARAVTSEDPEHPPARPRLRPDGEGSIETQIIDADDTPGPSRLRRPGKKTLLLGGAAVLATVVTALGLDTINGVDSPPKNQVAGASAPRFPSEYFVSNNNREPRPSGSSGDVGQDIDRKTDNTIERSKDEEVFTQGDIRDSNPDKADTPRTATNKSPQTSPRRPSRRRAPSRRKPRQPGATADGASSTPVSAPEGAVASTSPTPVSVAPIIPASPETTPSSTPAPSPCGGLPNCAAPEQNTPPPGSPSPPCGGLPSCAGPEDNAPKP